MGGRKAEFRLPLYFVSASRHGLLGAEATIRRLCMSQFQLLAKHLQGWTSPSSSRIAFCQLWPGRAAQPAPETPLPLRCLPTEIPAGAHAVKK